VPMAKEIGDMLPKDPFSENCLVCFSDDCNKGQKEGERVGVMLRHSV
jgi:hypothetical protein